MNVTVGSRLPVHEVQVDAGAMKTMAALLGDPNPIHWDTRVVAELGLGERPVNQGPLNMGYLMTMLARWAGGRDRVLDFRVRFLGNVLAGDRVRAEGTVTGLRVTGAGQVADCEVALKVIGGDTALSGTASVLVEPLRSGDHHTMTPVAVNETERER
jgi:acyl dehydratase